LDCRDIQKWDVILIKTNFLRTKVYLLVRTQFEVAKAQPELDGDQLIRLEELVVAVEDGLPECRRRRHLGVGD